MVHLPCGSSAWSVTLGKSQTSQWIWARWGPSPTSASSVELKNALARGAVGTAAVAAHPQPGAPAAWGAACHGEPKAGFLLGAGIGNNDLNECSCEVQLTELALGSLCSTGLVIKLSQGHGICCRGVLGSCGIKGEGVNLYMQKHLCLLM